MRFLKDKLIHHLQKLNFLYIHQSFLLKPSLLKVCDPGQVCSILELLKTSFPHVPTRTIFYAMEYENIHYKSGVVNQNNTNQTTRWRLDRNREERKIERERSWC